jgi:Copper transport outer membrane protein, MctB
LGYSARYHAASLAAVFLALAIGILIGVGLGGNVLSGTEESLRDSLEGDIDEARAEADDLRTDLERERAFSSRAYPALVGDSLRGRRIGVLAFGELPSDLASDVEEALEPTGGELVEVAVAVIPPDADALASQLGPGRLSLADEDPAVLEELGLRLGSQFVLGDGGQLEKVRNILFSRLSGEGGELDGVILVRGPEPELEPENRAAADALESGLVGGVAETGVPAVGVERSDAEDSSVSFFQPQGVTTVDSVDLTSGQAAMVFAMLGAKGNFGIKSSANSLLPELLDPSGAVGRSR